jgi:aryl-alcohol dehydrogenase-like predicted oxidoreductase
MEKRQLGQSSLKISPLTLGAWAIGGWLWGGTNESDAIAAINISLDLGVNMIDTAPVYGMGKSEELVAKAIQGRRHEVILATKCGLRWDSNEGVDPWLVDSGLGKKLLIRKNSKPDSIFYECEQSLKRLQTDVIDLYQIHWPDTSTPIADSWNAMVQLKKAGKVRAIGVSNYSLQQLREAHAIHPVDSLQPPYSLIRRDIEKDLVPFCVENRISILAYSPLERGLLTGKVTPERHFPKGDHREQHPTFSQENRKAILEALDQIRPFADKYHATLSQIIISCTVARPGITSAIVGARNAAQALENGTALKISLTADERDRTLKILEPLKID